MNALRSKTARERIHFPRAAHRGGLLVLATALLCAGCSRPANPETASKGAVDAPQAESAWLAITPVLDGTDLVEMEKIGPVPFTLESIAGTYRSEQGGSVLVLTIQRDNGGIRVERPYQEPGAAKAVKTYHLAPLASKGAASPSRDCYLQKTREGVAFWEKSSGTDSIPATYWTHYIRQ
jgi:hypothetical protein